MTILLSAVLGILIGSTPVVLPGGQMGWQCTYTVSGQTVNVLIRGMCPATMEF